MNGWWYWVSQIWDTSTLSIWIMFESMARDSQRSSCSNSKGLQSKTQPKHMTNPKEGSSCYMVMFRWHYDKGEGMYKNLITKVYRPSPSSTVSTLGSHTYHYTIAYFKAMLVSWGLRDTSGWLTFHPVCLRTAFVRLSKNGPRRPLAARRARAHRALTSARSVDKKYGRVVGHRRYPWFVWLLISQQTDHLGWGWLNFHPLYVILCNYILYIYIYIYTY